MKKLIATFALLTLVTSFAEIFRPLSALAQNGSITGTAPKVKKFVAGTTRVYSLGTPAVYGKDLSSKRSFQFSVPEGGYVVISDVLGKKERTSSIAVVPVRKGKKAKVKALSALSADSAQAIRVSVGNVQLRTPDGKPLKARSGKNITIDGLLIVDLLNSRNECNFAIVEDRKFGRFKDVLKEIRLQSSKLSANKVNYKAAIATLNANAPQYRLTGSVEVNEQEDLTGNSTLQIVNIQSGEVVWQKTFTGGGTDLANFSEPLAQAAADALCIPQEVSGTFSGVQKSEGSGFSVTYSWTGTAKFRFLNYLGEDPSKPENLNVALYQFVSGEISSFSASGTNNGCSVSGETSSLQPEFPSTGALMVYLDPVPGGGYRYSLAATLQKPDAVEITTACPDATSSRTEAAVAELVVSNSEDDLPVTPDLHRYIGAAKILETEMSWSFNSGLR